MCKRCNNKGYLVTKRFSTMPEHNCFVIMIVACMDCKRFVTDTEAGASFLEDENLAVKFN